MKISRYHWSLELIRQRSCALRPGIRTSLGAVLQYGVPGKLLNLGELLSPQLGLCSSPRNPRRLPRGDGTWKERDSKDGEE